MSMYKAKLSNLIFLLMLSPFLLAACAGDKLSVKSEYRDADFEAFETYRWYEKKQTDMKSTVTEITYDYIKQAIGKELTSKQISYVAEGPVDFYVNVTVTAEMRVEIKDYQVYSGVNDGYSFRRGTGFQSNLSTEQQTDFIYYRDGTLLVDVIDPASDKLIWRGVANKRLPKKKEVSQQKREKMIDQAVSEVLARFPPQ